MEKHNGRCGRPHVHEGIRTTKHRRRDQAHAEMLERKFEAGFAKFWSQPVASKQNRSAIVQTIDLRKLCSNSFSLPCHRTDRTCLATLARTNMTVARRVAANERSVPRILYRVQWA